LLALAKRIIILHTKLINSMSNEKSGHQNYREALDNATKLRYLRGIADPGTSDDALMKSSGIKQHPTTQAKNALDQMVREDYIRKISRPF
jgi:hypothetical protein